jgi:hypothetical protein
MRGMAGIRLRSFFSFWMAKQVIVGFRCSAEALGEDRFHSLHFLLIGYPQDSPESERPRPKYSSSRLAIAFIRIHEALRGCSTNRGEANLYVPLPGPPFGGPTCYSASIRSLASASDDVLSALSVLLESAIVVCSRLRKHHGRKAEVLKSARGAESVPSLRFLRVSVPVRAASRRR